MGQGSQGSGFGGVGPDRGACKLRWLNQFSDQRMQAEAGIDRLQGVAAGRILLLVGDHITPARQRHGHRMGGVRQGMAEIRALIDKLRGRHSILLSTHLLSEVTQICVRVLIIAGGRKVAEGTEAELRSALGAQGRVRVSLERPDESVVGRLRALNDVEEVTSLGEGRFEITCSPRQGGACKDDPRVKINAALQPYGLLESRSEGDLEELYLKAVSVR